VEGKYDGCILYSCMKMKPIEIILRKGKGMRENNGGVNLIKIYCKHICKCHNVSPCTIIYANKIFKFCISISSPIQTSQ
jgi:hypothetical protein